MRWIGWIGALAFTLAPVWACSLEDALENAPCESDDDCIGEQSCVKTVHQAAAGGVGWCRSDGKCVAGQQEGCIAADGACTVLPLFVVTDPATQISYCCDPNGGDSAGLAVVDADGSSARCLACAVDLCYDQGALSEPCSMGEPRCTIIQDTCGCRVPEAQVEDSECTDDATCGEGFVCTRTLEQEAESPQSEPLPENQVQELGWCRPVDAPECAGGYQVGCRTVDSCPGNSLNFTCTDAGRCYCCAEPASSSFNVHVYSETAMGESAACVECRSSDCNPGTTTCTVLEDPTCVVTSGVCGCTPPA